MIDKEIISKNEAENDGQTIHLYYDEIAGMYMAFGLYVVFRGTAKASRLVTSRACILFASEPEDQRAYHTILLHLHDA